jgi:hypothetical protein
MAGARAGRDQQQAAVLYRGGKRLNLFGAVRATAEVRLNRCNARLCGYERSDQAIRLYVSRSEGLGMRSPARDSNRWEKVTGMGKMPLLLLLIRVWRWHITVSVTRMW